MIRNVHPCPICCIYVQGEAPIMRMLPFFSNDSIFFWRWPTDVSKPLFFDEIYEIIFLAVIMMCLPYVWRFIYMWSKFIFIDVMYYAYDLYVLMMPHVWHLPVQYLISDAVNNMIWLIRMCENVIWSKNCVNCCTCRYFQKRQAPRTLKVRLTYDTTSWKSRNTCMWLMLRWEA